MIVLVICLGLGYGLYNKLTKVNQGLSAAGGNLGMPAPAANPNPPPNAGFASGNFGVTPNG